MITIDDIWPINEQKYWFYDNFRVATVLKMKSKLLEYMIIDTLL